MVGGVGVEGVGICIRNDALSSRVVRSEVGGAVRSRVSVVAAVVVISNVTTILSTTTSTIHTTTNIHATATTATTTSTTASAEVQLLEVAQLGGVCHDAQVPEGQSIGGSGGLPGVYGVRYVHRK